MSDSIAYLVVQIAKAQRNLVGSRLREINLYPGQDVLLSQLWQNDGLTNGELAEKMLVEPAAITKAVKRMENAGWVKRQADDDDGRISRIFLTRKGQNIQEQVEEIWSEIEGIVSEGISQDERLLLIDALTRIRSNLL